VTVAKEPDRRGEHEVTVKPLRGDCRVSGVTVAHHVQNLLLRAHRRPGIPAPSDREGKEFWQSLGRDALRG